MVSIPKVVGVISCGFLLFLGLSHVPQAGNAALAADELKAGQSEGGQPGQKKLDDPMKGGQSKGGKTIKGEVLRVEDGNYFVKGGNNKEVRLHTDNTTQITGNIQQGDWIEAKLNDQNHALSIISLGRATGAGHENETSRDSLGEVKN